MTLNIIGLILNFLGTLSLLFFGVPNDIRPKGETMLIIGSGNPKLITKAKKYKFIQSVGIILLATGFILQLISELFCK